MSTITELKRFTEEFFKMHWSKESKNEFPVWSEHWKFKGELPNNTKQGCYSWIKDDKVLYIGVALNSGVAGYENHSLGTRITKYWNVNNEIPKENGVTTYKAIANLEKHGIDSITTLAFPPDDQEYLAAALEIFLIQRLSPECNKIHKVASTEKNIS